MFMIHHIKFTQYSTSGPQVGDRVRGEVCSSVQAARGDRGGRRGALAHRVCLPWGGSG